MASITQERRQSWFLHSSQSEPPESHPTSNDEQEEPDSAAPLPCRSDDTDEQRL
ncbi:hypothetical protein Pst134EA_032665, partial [Puccinia striiformis f. sp. tritici]|uniref:uncharacterized protein n=1 Tax=Puccinia striiformis f. sp. tritici TaxID=168172 RepID=UPI0020073AAA